MRSLYNIIEGILDTDTQVQDNVINGPLYDVVNLLSLDKPEVSVHCSYDIRNGHLYITGRRNHVTIFRIMNIDNEFVLSETGKSVNVRIMKYVHFDNITFGLTTDIAPEFLSNCNNCYITYTGLHKEKSINNLDSILSKTKGNTIVFNSSVTVANRLYDYSFLSNLKFKTCRVVLNYSAILDTIKNFTARELVIQRGSKFSSSDDAEFFTMTNDNILSEYNTQELNRFLRKNNITSLGMVDAFVRFIDWVIKEGDTYTFRFLKSDSNRIPKIE